MKKIEVYDIQEQVNGSKDVIDVKTDHGAKELLRVVPPYWATKVWGRLELVFER